MGQPVDELYQTYLSRRPNLVRFFAARLGSKAAAEDLVQEIYLKLAVLPPDQSIDSPAAFLYRIGANLMLDRLRQDRRSRNRDSDWSELSRVSLGGEDVADEPPADRVVDARQRLSRLQTAVAQLPTQMQRAFRLHKLEGLSQAETAKAMGISLSAVEKHISASLKNLLKALE